MKYGASKNKTTRRAENASSQASAIGQEAVSIAPPEYGIDFVDGDAASSPAASGKGGAIVQRKLVEDDPINAKGFFTDSRDPSKTPYVFRWDAPNVYREMYTDEAYIYYPQADQFQNQTLPVHYLDLNSHQEMIWNDNTNSYRGSSTGQYYSYDGANYAPYQQQETVAPSVSDTSFKLGGGTVSANSSSSSGSVVKDNDFFRNLVNSGSTLTGSSVAREKDTLAGSLRALEQQAMRSEKDLETVLDHLATSQTHARGVKGLPGRIADAGEHEHGDKGHEHAAFATFETFKKLLAIWQKKKKEEWVTVTETCRGLGFDKPPKKWDDDDGSKKLDSARTRPRRRLIL